MRRATAPSFFGSLATCYQCSFQSTTVSSSTCPECSFPLILEKDATPSGGIRIEDILKRQSVRQGAPPLPGVDAEKRQAQILAEARQARRARLAKGSQVSEAPALEEIVEIALPAEASTWRVAMVCFSAVAAGILAAMLHNGM